MEEPSRTRNSLESAILHGNMEREVVEVKGLLMEKPVAIITDEMSDDNGRYALNILAAPLELTGKEDSIKSLLIDTVFLENTNHSSVSQAVVAAVTAFGINYNNVLIINTDNAAYMRKAFSNVLSGLFPNAVHITCLAHVMNLLGDAFKKPFKLVNSFVKSMNAMFYKAGARKSRFLTHMKNCMPGKIVTMPPNPISTRWNCWYDCVKYHVSHFDHYKAFVSSEMDLSKSLAPDSLKQLMDMFADDRNAALLFQHMKFVVDKSEIFVKALNIFQSQQPLALKAWSMLQDLESQFGAGGVTLREISAYFLEDSSMAEKVALQDLCSQAYSLVSSKLGKYMTAEGQPGIEFLQQVQFFSPSKLIFFSENTDELSTLKLLQKVPVREVNLYFRKLGPEAVKRSVGPLDVQHFWSSMTEDLPTLAPIAKQYICATINSADAERSFSIYNLILSDRRRSLNMDSMRSFSFLCYNDFVGTDFLL